MTDPRDQRVGLHPLTSDPERRAERIVSAVMGRVAHARSVAADRAELRDAVTRQLARFAGLAALGAAASLAAVLLTGRSRRVQPEPFAALVLAPGPARLWVALDRHPDAGELAAVVAASR